MALATINNSLDQSNRLSSHFTHRTYKMFFSDILSILYFYFRPFIKWFLHRFTRLCELQRICYGAPAGAARAHKVEMSLRLSRRDAIKDALKILDECVEHCSDEEFRDFIDRAVGTVMRAKKIKPKLHPDFARLFGRCLEQIWGYRRLFFTVEAMRTTQYDSDNLDHEKKLLQLWRLLMPNDRLETRITKQWQEIGFQGDDPKTDFRGMGILGLENLLFFAEEYNSAARHVLLHSHHPNHGYTFAIVGINLTSMAYNLLKSGKAKTHFYNLSRRILCLENFHKFYCYLVFEFDKFWIESEPRSIMDFTWIHQRFEEDIVRSLEDEKTVFKMNLVVENI